MSLTPRLALLLTVPPLLWAGNAIVGRMMVGQVPPQALNLLRWLLAGALLLPLAWHSLKAAGGWPSVARRWPYLLLVGGLGVGLYNAMQYLALVTSTPLNVTLVACSMPMWTLIVGALFFGERPARGQVAGTALGIVGVLLVIGRGSPQALLSVQLVPGDLYILVAVVGWAFYSWLLVRPPAHMQGSERPPWDWSALLFAQVLFGLPTAGAFAAVEHALGAPPVAWSPAVFAALAYVAVCPSILAYRCYGLGMAQGGPAMAALFANLTPVITATLSAALLGEWPQAYHVVAFGLIAGGIVVSSRRRGSA